MEKKFQCIRPSREHDGFSVSYIVQDSDELYEVQDKSKVIHFTDLGFEEPFLLWDPEYAFSPVYEKKYPVVLGDWNLNAPIFLQNIDKFSVIFLDEVGKSQLSGRIPAKVVGVPIFVSYVDVVERSDVNQVLKSKKIDVLFVGSFNPGIHSRRNKLLKKILTLPEDYKVAVVCGLYDRILYSEALSASKIVFNYSVKKEMNMRVFETLKSGACLFLEDDNVETWKYLKKFEEAVPYAESNITELIQKYISDDVERERITTLGYQKIKGITKGSVFKRMLEELKNDDIYRKSFQSDVSSFRSYINHIFNFPVCINDKNLGYAESWCFSLAENADRYIKSSLLSDLAFLYMISAVKINNGKEKFLEKSLRYLNSAVSFNPKSLIFWYNLAFLNYSMKNLSDFQTSCSNFFKCLKDLPLDESMKHIRGFPEPFSPIIFSHYSIFRTYIDNVWIKSFEDTQTLREEIARVLSAQVYVFLCNFALERGDYREAEKFCLQSLSLFQNLTSVYYTLGKIYMGMGRFREAAEAYIKAYEEDPLFFEKWIEIIYALYASGNKDKLDEIFREMKLISSRLYFFSGQRFGISIGNADYNITVKSVKDFINEHILTHGR